jgi:hypothetical protein
MNSVKFRYMKQCASYSALHQTLHHDHVECIVAAMLERHHVHFQPSIVMPFVWAQLRATTPSVLTSKYCAACSVACS